MNDDTSTAPKKRHLLDYPASYWDGVARKIARTKNPHAWRLDALDTLIGEAEKAIISSEDRISSMRREKARLLNDDEKNCNLLAALASWSECEAVAKKMTIQELADKAFEEFHCGALGEAVLNELLARAGYIYIEEEITK